MDQQEIFTKVWDHFIVSKAPLSFVKSEEAEPRCRYRGPNGEKCAVGLFIDDAAYDETIEGRDVQQLIIDHLAPEVVEENPLLFLDLQAAHDNATKPEVGDDAHAEMADALRHVAKQWGLSVPA